MRCPARHIRHLANLIGPLLLLPLSVLSQSAFMITKGELHPTYKGFISFANTVTNVSSNILPEFGVFMCTEPGTYHFTMGAATERDEPFRIVLKRNRDSIATLYGSFNDYQQVSQTAVLQLHNGDYVYPFVEVGEIFESPIEDRAYTVFTGFQIGAGDGQPPGQTSVPTRAPPTSGRSVSSTTSSRSSSTATITAQGTTTRVGGSTTRPASAATSATTRGGTSSGGTTGRTTITTGGTARTTTGAGVTTTRASGTTVTTGTTSTRPGTTTARPGTTSTRPGTTTARPGTTTTRSGTTTTRSGTTSARSGTTTTRPQGTTSARAGTTTRTGTTTTRSGATSTRSGTTTTRSGTTSARPLTTTTRPIATTSRRARSLDTGHESIKKRAAKGQSNESRISYRIMKFFENVVGTVLKNNPNITQ